MGVLFDYFAAPSDDAAVTALDAVGGPTTAQPYPFETVATRVDPEVQMRQLESLLTGVPYATLRDDPGSSRLVAERNEQMVVTVTDGLQAALASADDGRVAEVAVPWSQTEEFWGGADPDEITALLRSLAALARSATDRGDRLYCWVSL